MLRYSQMRTAQRPPDDKGLGRKIVKENWVEIFELLNESIENPKTDRVLNLGNVSDYLSESDFVSKPTIQEGLSQVKVLISPRNKGQNFGAFINALPAIVMNIGGFNQKNLKPNRVKDMLSSYLSHEIIHAIAWAHHRKPPQLKEEVSKRNQFTKPEELIAHVMNVAADIARIYAGEEHIDQSKIMREIENHPHLKRLDTDKQKSDFKRRVFQKALEILNFKRDAKESNLR